jgi:hypothetical protein
MMGWQHLLDHALAHARNVSMVVMIFLLATGASLNPTEKSKYQRQTPRRQTKRAFDDGQVPCRQIITGSDEK